MAVFQSSDINFTVEFDVEAKQFRVRDNVDYSAFDFMPLASLRGLGQASSPPNNAAILVKLSPADPLIANLESGDKESAWYDLNTDSNGDIVNGTYAFLYRVYIPYNIQDQPIASFGAGNTLVVTGYDLTNIVIADSTMTISGATTVGNNGVKTVSSVTYDGSDSTITVTTDLTAEAGGSAVFDYFHPQTLAAAKTQVYVGCDEVTPSLVISSDCTGSQFGSLTVADNTVYGNQTIVDRVIQVYAPSGLVPAPPENPWETSSSDYAAITIDQLATGTWTAVLQADLSYIGTDGLVVFYSLSAPTNTFTATVECDSQLCDLKGCIAEFWRSFYGCARPTPSQTLKATQLSLALTAYETAKNCADADQMATYVSAIEEILGGDCTCGSSTGAPQWVNNSSDSGQTTINELEIQIANLTEIVNDYNQGSELLFKATWTQSADGSLGQIVPFTIPKEYYQIGTTAPYYESPAFAKMVLEFKVNDPGAQIVLYNQTDGAAWATLNVGALGVQSGRITMYWSSWNSLPACTLITEYEDGSNGYTHDETNLTGVAADWDLTADLLVNIQPNDIDEINYAFVEVIGHKINTATS